LIVTAAVLQSAQMIRSGFRLLLFVAICFTVVPPGLAPAQTAVLAGLAGTWKLDLAKSKIPKVLKTQSQMMVVKPSASNVAFDFVTDGVPGRHRNYILDGNEHLYGQNGAIPNLYRSYYTAEVKPGVLAVHYRTRLETSASPTVGATEGNRSTERWEISPDGRTLTRTFVSGEPDFDGTCVYDKQ